MDSNTDNDEFLLDTERQPMAIPLFRLITLLIIIVGVFFGLSALLCFTKKECTDNVPSLYNMLNSPFSAPFVVTGLNTVLSIHGILVVALYGKTHYKSRYGSRLQALAALLLYLLIGITLFVFPFSYRVNYASILIILGIAAWEFTTLVALKSYYKGHLRPKPVKHWMLLSVLMFMLYVISAAIYVGLKFSYQSELGIMIVELVCGFSIFMYLILLLYHVGNIKIEIKS